MAKRLSGLAMGRKTLTVLAWLMLGVLSAPAAPAPASKDPPQPFPKEIVTAWQKVGARVGWMGLSSDGSPDFAETPDGLRDAAPAFGFYSSPWKGGAIAHLPAPEVPFGLVLQSLPVKDTDLEELARFKNLQAI